MSTETEQVWTRVDHAGFGKGHFLYQEDIKRLDVNEQWYKDFRQVDYLLADIGCEGPGIVKATEQLIHKLKTAEMLRESAEKALERERLDIRQTIKEAADTIATLEYNLSFSKGDKRDDE